MSLPTNIDLRVFEMQTLEHTAKLSKADYAPWITQISAEKLTDAETRVLICLASGVTPKEIAQNQGKKISTIRTHIKNIHAKLNARSTLQALYFAKAHGWIS